MNQLASLLHCNLTITLSILFVIPLLLCFAKSVCNIRFIVFNFDLNILIILIDLFNMSNSDGKELNSIGNSEWTPKATRQQRQTNLQQQMEAAKQRKAQRQAKLQMNNNNQDNTNNATDDSTRNTRSSRFIHSYQQASRRWTTNTTTTRFLPNRKPSAQLTSNSNNNSINTDTNAASTNNDNSNSSITNSRVFTQSFLQAHRSQQSQTTSMSNSAMNAFPSRSQHISNRSSNVGHNASNPIVLDQPSHPIHNLSYDQLQSVAANRHGSRIFHGASSNTGAKSVITDHVIGVHKPPSIVSTANPSQFDDLGDSISQFNTASRMSQNNANLATMQQSQPSHNTLNQHNHNHDLNYNSPPRRQSSNNNTNDDFRDSRDPRLRRNIPFGQQPTFEQRVYREQTPDKSNNKSNNNNNNDSPTLTDRVYSPGERKYDSDKFNPTAAQPQKRTRISLNASSIQHLHPTAQKQIMNDTTFLHYQANALGEPVIWKNTQSDTGIYGVNYRAHRQSRVSSKFFDPLSIINQDNPENKDYNDNKDDSSPQKSNSAIDLTGSDTLDNQDLPNVNNRRARRHRSSNSNNDNSNDNHSPIQYDESKDHQLPSINGQLQFQPRLSMLGWRYPT